MDVPRRSIGAHAGAGPRPRTITALVAALLLVAPVAVSCAGTTGPPTPAAVLVTTPEAIDAGSSGALGVAIVRGDELGELVRLRLITTSTGITADHVWTTDALAVVTVEVAASVPAGSYPLVVEASAGGVAVESEPVTLTVVGAAAGAVRGEVRSFLIPTAGAAGFTTAGLPDGDPVEVGISEGGRCCAAPRDAAEQLAVPGEVLVRFHAGSAPAARAALAPLTVAGVSVQAPAEGLRPGTLQRWRAAEPITVAQTIALADAFARRPDVLTASPNWLFRAFGEPPQHYHLQWHFPTISLHAAWGIEHGASTAVTVAVIDSGSQDHVDLQGLWLPGYDFVDLDGDPTDPHPTFGHGTHVASTTAMRTSGDPKVAGVSRGASLLPVRVLDDQGGTFEAVLAGIVWASGLEVPDYAYPAHYGAVPANPNPARVLNLSLGGRVGACPAELAAVTTYLEGAGVVLVAAAGNDGVDVAEVAPANCPGVVTVAATGPYDERPPYSNFGPGIDVSAPGGDFDHAYAGEGSATARPAGVLGASGTTSYVWAEGTSMAAPHVSGVAALLLAAEPDLTPAEVLERVTSTAAPMSAAQCGRPDPSDCGSGRIDAHAALGGGAAEAWNGAPTVTIALHPCAPGDCSGVDPDVDAPATQLDGPLTRAYWSFELPSVAAGTYLLHARVLAPGTAVPSQQGAQTVQVLAHTTTAVTLMVAPD